MLCWIVDIDLIPTISLLSTCITELFIIPQQDQPIKIIDDQVALYAQADTTLLILFAKVPHSPLLPVINGVLCTLQTKWWYSRSTQHSTEWSLYKFVNFLKNVKWYTMDLPQVAGMKLFLGVQYIEGILPKRPHPPCLRMADRALLAGYPRYVYNHAFCYCRAIWRLVCWKLTRTSNYIPQSFDFFFDLRLN